MVKYHILSPYIVSYIWNIIHTDLGMALATGSTLLISASALWIKDLLASSALNTSSLSDSSSAVPSTAGPQNPPKQAKFITHMSTIMVYIVLINISKIYTITLYYLTQNGTIRQ